MKKTYNLREYLSGQGRTVVPQQAGDVLEARVAQDEFRNQGWAMEHSQRQHTLMHEREWAGFGTEYEALHGNSAWGIDLWNMD